MESLNITKEELEKIQRISLNSIIHHSEGDLFFYNENGIIKIVKKLYNPNGIYFSNKLYTINTLIDEKEKIDIPELIIPEKLLSIKEDVVGYLMPYIEGENLAVALKSDNISLEQKIDYLKQIGIILEKMSLIRKKYSNIEFYLNDLHESNFVIDKQNKVHVVDLDSCSIMGNYPFGTKYLSSFSPLNLFPNKYNNKLTYSCGGEFIPNTNTDLYCYNIIILNFLFGFNMTSLSIEEFNYYVQYLTTINANEELVDAFSRLYSNHDNKNVWYLLDSLVDIYNKTINFQTKSRRR